MENHIYDVNHYQTEICQVIGKGKAIRTKGNINGSWSHVKIFNLTPNKSNIN